MRLEFSTGEIKEFDFTPLLDTPCFLPLRDKALFDKVYLDHGIPSWDGGNIDIAPEAFFAEDYWKPVLETDLTAEKQAIIDAGDREFQEHPETFVPLESINKGY
jgi:hypothetical protein